MLLWKRGLWVCLFAIGLATPSWGAGKPKARSKPLRVVLGSHPGGRALDQTEYVPIRDAGFAVMQRFDPKHHVIVGLGRSPTPVISFLKNLSVRGRLESGDVGAYATSLPASGLNGKIDSKHWPAYRRHLERFLPESALSGQKNVVLVDGISTGASVEVAAAFLQSYWKERGVSGNVILSGFHRGSSAPAGFQSFSAARYPGAVVSNGGGVAEYDAHYIGTRGNGLRHLVANPAHRRYRIRMLRAMSSDLVLDSFLRTEMAKVTQLKPRGSSPAQAVAPPVPTTPVHTVTPSASSGGQVRSLVGLRQRILNGSGDFHRVGRAWTSR